MSKNGVCIICRENKDDLSDEHVIPDSIGGYYHIYTVCKTCNSNLGRNVDIKLLEHSLTKFMRFSTVQQGKRKQVPNPFSGTHKFKDNNTRVRLDLKNNSELKPYILPNCQNTYDELTKTHNFSFQLDGSERHLINEKARLVLKRAKIDEVQIQNILKNLNPTTIQIDSPIEIRMDIDTKEFKIGLLKIAYEFAVDTIPGYFEDKQAIEISNILRNANSSNIDKYVPNNGFDRKMLKPFNEFIDFEKNRHVLYLTNVTGGGLVCFVFLHNLFNVVVRLSMNTHLKKFINILGINDVDNRKFEKLYIEQMNNRMFLNKDLNYKFYSRLYKISSIFKYCTNYDTLPIYDSNFKIKFKNINQLLESRLIKINILSENKIYQKILIEIFENLYIQIIPSTNFIQLKSIDFVRETRKI